jgi:hypothetical protein
MPIAKCLICNAEFVTITTGKLCSDECKKKHKSLINAKFHEKNKIEVNEKNRLHYRNNIEYFRERDRIKRQEEKDIRLLSGKIVRKRHDYSNLSEEEKDALKRDHINEKKRQRYKEDELYAVKTRIRSLVNKVMREQGLAKSASTEEFLGCDYETFMRHIESTFKDGMSWNNRHLWHIDHIIPISNACNADDIKRLSNFRNLHAMWAEENIRKSNKLGFTNVTGIMIKTYDERGDYEQFRNENIVTFRCFKCEREKKSKLVVVFKGDWQKIICNGCYGAILSKSKN